jgi:hypothetical protein
MEPLKPSRRGLLGFLAVLPLAGKALELSGPAPRTLMPEVAPGFGLAPLKEEGTKIAYDGVLAHHPAALWPGVKEWWGKQYAEYGDQYADLFK